MTRYLIMSCEFILTVNIFMFNMSCLKPSCSHFQFNELVLNNFRLMYNVTVSLCNMLNKCHCPVYLPTSNYISFCCLFFSVDLCSIFI